MNCTQANECMMKYFDGEFNDIETAQLKQHFKLCPKCEEEFEGMQKVLAMVEAEGAAEPPEDFELKVMEKVNVIEEVKKKNTARWLMLLYNASTLVSIALLLLFVADIKDINIMSGLNGAGDYFTSFSGVIAGLYEVVKGIYGLVLNVVGIILQVFVTLVKNYYYIFIAMLALLLGIQKLFFVLVDRDGREKA